MSMCNAFAATPETGICCEASVSLGTWWPHADARTTESDGRIQTSKVKLSPFLVCEESWHTLLLSAWYANTSRWLIRSGDCHVKNLVASTTVIIGVNYYGGRA